MSSEAALADLRRRFIDDRDSLHEREYAQLVAAAKASPEFAAELHAQLVIDELLSQRLTLDRRRFDAQVEQRVADFLRGEEELNRQTDELRALALARIEQGHAEPRISRSTLIAWGIAAVLLLAIGLTSWRWQHDRYQALTATVQSVEGEVLIRRAPQAADQFATPESALRLGDEIEVGEEGKIELAWSDGTHVELQSGASLELLETLQGKRVHLSRGTLLASIAKQRDGEPMVFSTPHAEAIVRGTELQLHVEGDDTRLEVDEGEVEFVERQTRSRTLVATSQSATATAGQQVAKETQRWPATRDGLVYLFSPAKPFPVVKSGAGFKPTQLTGLSAQARVNERGEIEFAGDCLRDEAPPLSAALHGPTQDFTIELLIASSRPDQRGTIFSLVAVQGAAVSITQAGAATEPSSEAVDHVITVPRTDADELTQVVVIFRPQQRVADIFIAGEAQPQQQLQLPQWWNDATSLSILLGGTEAEARWHGRIAGLAIYDKASPPKR